MPHVIWGKLTFPNVSSCFASCLANDGVQIHLSKKDGPVPSCPLLFMCVSSEAGGGGGVPQCEKEMNTNCNLQLARSRSLNWEMVVDAVVDGN